MSYGILWASEHVSTVYCVCCTTVLIRIVSSGSLKEAKTTSIAGWCVEITLISIGYCTSMFIYSSRSLLLTVLSWRVKTLMWLQSVEIKIPIGLPGASLTAKTSLQIGVERSHRPQWRPSFYTLWPRFEKGCSLHMRLFSSVYFPTVTRLLPSFSSVNVAT